MTYTQHVPKSCRKEINNVYELHSNNNHKLYNKFISVFNQLDAQNFVLQRVLFHASTCFEHISSKHVEA